MLIAWLPFSSWLRQSKNTANDAKSKHSTKLAYEKRELMLKVNRNMRIVLRIANVIKSTLARLSSLWSMKALRNRLLKYSRKLNMFVCSVIFIFTILYLFSSASGETRTEKSRTPREIYVFTLFLMPLIDLLSCNVNHFIASAIQPKRSSVAKRKFFSEQKKTTSTPTKSINILVEKTQFKVK